MKLSVPLPLLLLVASLGVAVPPQPPSPQSASTAVEGLEGGKSTRKCGPKCQRRKERLRGDALPVDPVNTPGHIQTIGPPKEGSGADPAVDKPRKGQLQGPPSPPAGPPSSYGFPSGSRGPPAPSFSFQDSGPSGPRDLGPPGPRRDFYGGGALPPPGRGPGNSEVVGPPGLLNVRRLCGKNQAFVGNNLCVCVSGFVMNRNNVCRPVRKQPRRFTRVDRKVKHKNFFY